jgi:hypothetical protein
MSLSIEPETKDWLDVYASEEGESSSKIVRECVKKYLINKDQITVIEKPSDQITVIEKPKDQITVIEHSEEFIPVVLKIPSNLRGDPKVKEWLQVRCDAIGAKLGQSNVQN